MVPFLGAFPLIALALAFTYASIVAIASALSFGLSNAFGGGNVTGALGTVLLSVLGILGVELLLRARDARRDPRWAGDLRTLSLSRTVSPDRIGMEAQTLSRVVALGVSVPETLVLTSELTEAWLKESRAARRDADPQSSLPAGALGSIQAFLHSSAGGRLQVRPSFRGVDPAATYPGVFITESDVDPSDTRKLLSAIQRVAESGDGPAALDYRRRMRQVATLARSVVLQRQIDADVSGVVQSRGIDGRADSVLIDFAKRRAPTMTVSFDLIDGTVLAIAPHTALDSTPSWMNRLAALAVALDRELGGTVLVHFAVERGQLWVQSVRRVQTETPKTWVSSGGPLEALFPRLPRFVCETFGDASVLTEGANEALGGLTTVAPDEVRFEEGVRYLDMEVLRRALGRLAVEVLFSEPIWRLFALARPVPRRPFAKPPEVGQEVGTSFRRLEAWRARVLLPLSKEHVALGLRRWLIESVVGMLSDGATGEPVPGVHKRLKPLLGRRAASCSGESERARRHLEESEKSVRDFVAQVVARGATDWSGVFVGDRHLYAGRDEMKLWISSPAEREAFAAAWDEEKLGFEARHLMETPERIVEPAPPDSMLSMADSALAVVGLTPGVARGQAAAPADARQQIPPGSIVVLPDGRPEFAWHVLSASGVILTGGGALSPMAQLARELGIPSVITVQRLPVTSLPLGQSVQLDGTQGSVEVR
ncbi:MAG: hypothetical protein IPI67_26240 [Myxococcales bacterium]|nr:hypothetical protein [Myxococcales bacterium]